MPKGRQSKVHARDGTNSWVILMAVGAILLALFLFWFSNTDWLAGHRAWQSTLNQVAGLVVATGLLGVAWELLGKRRFAEEVLAKARLSTDVVDAGIIRVTDQYLDEVEWAELFDDVNKLDIVVAYGRTWRNSHAQRLQKVASRSGTRMRVFLPDPNDDDTMRVMGERFNMTPDVVKQTVREAITDFSTYATAGQGKVEVYVRPGDAVFSCYRFDGRAVLTLYSHAKERRTSVPTLVVRGGQLFNFVYGEIKAIKSQSQRVPPAPKSGGS
ncbi:DUF2157 domain-containing protein [Ornithinimicrobium faecis]|uniref:DUF2157 domain-containing protein n=1 Tax=Ornithinimicrobium faecis TaxID=2934158 RepID=A0ABY4YU60_9MICO|nr:MULTISPECIES: DUF2157 domain-containing protein [Ornithinimicrobium]USQ80104.1 DUF2157 domain-containing protein [Ornithinimicrobium sp. HY1793]